MKKILLMIGCLFSTGLFAANTFLLNTTDYKIKAKIKYAGVFCDDKDIVMNPGSQKHVSSDCCLKAVSFEGLSGSVNGYKTTEIGGSPTGFGISCGVDNQFRVRASGNSLINERY